METVIIFNIVSLILGVIILAYIEIRNQWVYRVRTKILEENPQLYRRLPSYEYMVFTKFWVWDIEKFY